MHIYVLYAPHNDFLPYNGPRIVSCKMFMKSTYCGKLLIKENMRVASYVWLKTLGFFTAGIVKILEDAILGYWSFIATLCLGNTSGVWMCSDLTCDGRRS